MEEQGLNDPHWQDHLEAWLVRCNYCGSAQLMIFQHPTIQIRHRDLCFGAEIPPFKVVTEFLGVVNATKLLPKPRVPSFENPRPTQPKPCAGAVVAPVEDAVVMNTTDSEDAEAMPRKGKGKAHSRTTTTFSSKRAPVDSPTRAEPKSKRLRPLETTVTGRHDCGRLTVDEESLIDEAHLPSVQGKVRHGPPKLGTLWLRFWQVCDRCKGLGKTNCYPLWSLNYHVKVIRCMNCREDKRGCSFVKGDWGITSWPTIRRTPEGNARRAHAARAKREGKGHNAVHPKRPRTLRSTRNAPPAHPHEERTRAVTFASATPEVHDLSSSSTFEFIPENLLQYEQILKSPSRSLTSVGMALSNLQVARAREKAELAIYLLTVKTRRLVIDDLLNRLRLELGRMTMVESRATPHDQSELGRPEDSDAGYEDQDGSDSEYEE